MSLFSSRLRELRQKNRMTQADLASLLGTTAQNIAAYEKGREMNFDNLMVLCDRFNVSSDYFIGRTDYMNPQKESLSENLSETMGCYKNDFRELLNLKDFVSLIHFCNAYIQDKGKKLDIYDGDSVIGILTSERRYLTIIRRVLEQMSQEYYLANGIPKDRDISFDIDRLDEWEIDFEKNMKGGDSDEGI